MRSRRGFRQKNTCSALSVEGRDRKLAIPAGDSALFDIELDLIRAHAKSPISLAGFSFRKSFSQKETSSPIPFYMIPVRNQLCLKLYT
jgi:hypothetical protein